MSTSVFSNPAGAAAGHATAYVQALRELLGDRDPVAVQRQLVGALRRLCAGLTDEQLRRPERPGKWSVLDVIEHLADQELVNAFRIRSIVAEDQPPLRGYDQDAWAVGLRYGTTPPDELLALLASLRGRNLRLLESLSEAELDREGLHSERGPESVRTIRTLTAAHDLLHRRQIARIRAAHGTPPVPDDA